MCWKGGGLDAKGSTWAWHRWECRGERAHGLNSGVGELITCWKCKGPQATIFSLSSVSNSSSHYLTYFNPCSAFEYPCHDHYSKFTYISLCLHQISPNLNYPASLYTCMLCTVSHLSCPLSIVWCWDTVCPSSSMFLRLSLKHTVSHAVNSTRILSWTPLGGPKEGSQEVSKAT